MRYCKWPLQQGGNERLSTGWLAAMEAFSCCHCDGIITNRRLIKRGKSPWRMTASFQPSGGLRQAKQTAATDNATSERCTAGALPSQHLTGRLAILIRFGLSLIAQHTMYIAHLGRARSSRIRTTTTETRLYWRYSLQLRASIASKCTRRPLLDRQE